MWLPYVVVLALVGLAIKNAADTSGGAMPGDAGGGGGRLAARTFTPYELRVLAEAAARYGIERNFLVSLAAIENGPKVPSAEGMTRGLGVLPVASYPTFELQASGAALTIANTVRRYEENIQRSAYEGTHYSVDFIGYFSQGGPGYDGYARVGVRNDPTNLNANHVRNLSTAYAAVVSGSVVV